MNIQFNGFRAFVNSAFPSIDARFKPIVYVVSAIAIGLLLYHCYSRIAAAKKESEEAMDELRIKLKKTADSVKKSADKVTELAKSARTMSDKVMSPSGLDHVSIKVEPKAAPAADKVVGKGTVEMEKGTESPLTFANLLANSKKFEESVPFPTQENLIKNFANTKDAALNETRRAEILEHAKATHPILHARVWEFIPKFLQFKLKHGSAVEKECYKDMTPTELVDRLITKRPIMFLNSNDMYLLRNGNKGAGGFETIGTDKENGDLVLKDYQSYAEISLSAFLSMFVPTHFINKGDRSNWGVLDEEGGFEPKGIYVGMVGARFEKPGFMEWPHMVVTPTQNTAANGYGSSADPENSKTKELRLWAEFYQSKVGDVYAFPEYSDAEKDTTGRFVKIMKGYYLDTFVYKERLRLVLENFLLESNERAKEQGKMAYLHIVGLGLGNWQLDKVCQSNLMCDVYAELLTKHKLDHISDLDFSWFNAGKKKIGDVGTQGTFDSQGHGIKIHFSIRDPAEKLTGEDAGKLLIAQYAWDPNAAYAGNEYWGGALDGSGDPAAACCSLLPELQNPEINPYVRAKYLSVMPAVKG